LPRPVDPNLLVGFNTADDAGVYKISEDTALIQTVDFFTPVVDDPYMFGQISAANSLSDIYAMGGRPVTAMNVTAFSPKVFSSEILVEILRGGFDKVAESGAVIVGGHTIVDEELKYGLSVTGLCHPQKIITNAGAKPGDRLILTKPLGTGIITTALKSGKDLGELTIRVCRNMAQLNRAASAAMQEIGVHACTDITGFGLLGHAYEMAKASSVGLIIHYPEAPVYEEALDLAGKGFVPGGTRSNQNFLKDIVRMPASISDLQQILLFDAQTSGGLLISVSVDRTDALISALKTQGVETIAIIGEVTAANVAQIEVRI
jgi:selenide,water dikinase